MEEKIRARSNKLTQELLDIANKVSILDEKMADLENKIRNIDMHINSLLTKIILNENQEYLLLLDGFCKRKNAFIDRKNILQERQYRYAQCLGIA